MTIFMVNFETFTTYVAKPSIEEALKWAKKNYPTRKIIDIRIAR